MKSILIFFIIVTISQTLANISWRDTTKKIGYVQYVMLDYIKVIGYPECRSEKDEIESAQEKAVLCLAEIKANSSFCETFVGHFEKCTKSLVEKVESCMKPREEGLVKAVVTSIVSQAGFICNTDGEHILEIFNPCVWKSIFSRDVSHCYDGAREGMKELLNNNSTKKILPEACRFISSSKTCVTEKFNAQCQHEITRNTLEELFIASMKPCNDV